MLLETKSITKRNEKWINYEKRVIEIETPIYIQVNWNPDWTSNSKFLENISDSDAG